MIAISCSWQGTLKEHWRARAEGVYWICLQINSLTSELLGIVDAMYGGDPTLSMVHVAKKLRVERQLPVGRHTVARAIRDLGMRSYVRRVRALISAKAKVSSVSVFTRDYDHSYHRVQS